jgi:hypothetical protein
MRKEFTMNHLYRLLILTVLLAACAAPTTSTQTASQSTLPPPAAETMMPADTETMAPEATEAAMKEATPTTEMMAPTESMAATEPAAMFAPQTFVKMEVGVSGAATVDPATGMVTFSDDFNISSGPDLHVILSSASDLSLGYEAFSETVKAAPILFLDNLTSTSGMQAYTIPAGTDLSQYNTVIVWCRAFSVAFAAAPIR